MANLQQNNDQLYLQGQQAKQVDPYLDQVQQIKARIAGTPTGPGRPAEGSSPTTPAVNAELAPATAPIKPTGPVITPERVQTHLQADTATFNGGKIAFEPSPSWEEDIGYRTVIGGARDAAESVKNLTVDLGNLVAKNVLDPAASYLANTKPGSPEYYDALAENLKSRFSLPDVPEPDRAILGYARPVVQFLAPFAAIGKVGMIAKAGDALESGVQILASKTGSKVVEKVAGAAAKGIVPGAAADFTAFEPDQKRLSDLLTSVDNPVLNNTVTQYLAHHGDDTPLEGRLKNAIEGAGLGGLVNELILGIKATKASGAMRQVEGAAGRATAAGADAAPGTTPQAAAQATLSPGAEVKAETGAGATHATDPLINAGEKQPTPAAAAEAPAAPAAPIFAQADPAARDLAIRVMLGEASNQGDEGLAAVANVYANRATAGKYGKDLGGILKKKGAFEAYGDPTARAKLMAIDPNSEEYKKAAQIFDEVSNGTRPDNTGGATHYLNRNLQAAEGRDQPKWSKGKVLAQVGDHTFLSPDGAPVIRGVSASKAPAGAETLVVNSAAPGTSAERLAAEQAVPPVTPQAKQAKMAQFVKNARDGLWDKAWDDIHPIKNMDDNELAKVVGELYNTEKAAVEAGRGGAKVDATGRRVMSDAELADLTAKSGLTADDVLSFTEDQLSNFEVNANLTRYIARASAKNLKAATDEVYTSGGSPEAYEKLTDAYRFGLRALTAKARVAAASARSLRMERFFTEENQLAVGLQKALSDVRNVNTVRIGEIMKNMNNDQAGDFLVELGRRSYAQRAGDAVYEAFVNNILSGPATHLTNIVSNLAYGAQELTAHAVSAIPGARKAFRRYQNFRGANLGPAGQANINTFDETRAMLTSSLQGFSDAISLYGKHVVAPALEGDFVGAAKGFSTAADAVEKLTPSGAQGSKFESGPGAISGDLLNPFASMRDRDDHIGAFARMTDVGLDWLGWTLRRPTAVIKGTDDIFKAAWYRSGLTYNAMQAAQTEMVDQTLRSGKAILDPDAFAKANKEAIWQRAQDLMSQSDPNRFSAEDILKQDLVRRYASDLAKDWTFQSEMGKTGEAVQNLVSNLPTAKFVLPFVRTPTNLIYKGIIQYSPLADAPMLTRFNGQIREAIQRGGPEADLAMARVAVGTSLMAAMTGLAMDGRVQCSLSYDPGKRNVQRGVGLQPDSVSINGQNYSFQKIQPMALTACMATDISNALKVYNPADPDEDNAMMRMVGAGVNAIAASVGNSTWMESFAQFFGILSGTQNDGRTIGDFLSRQISSAAVPLSGLMKQTTREVDPYMREATSVWQQARAMIPGLSEGLPERRDFDGYPVKHTDAVSWGVLPVSRTKISTDPVYQEYYRLNMSMEMPPRSVGNGTRMNNEEYSTFLGIMADGKIFPGADGKMLTHHQYVEKLLNSDQYNKDFEAYFDKMYAQHPELPDSAADALRANMLSQIRQTAIRGARAVFLSSPAGANLRDRMARDELGTLDIDINNAMSTIPVEQPVLNMIPKR